MLTKSEERVLSIFRQFLVGPGEMLCLNAPQVKTYSSAIKQLIEKGFLQRETFKGGYSLTREGFSAMRSSH